MKSATRLTSKGQVVSPKPVRQHLRWCTGLRLEVEALPNGGVRLAPISDDAIEFLILPQVTRIAARPYGHAG